MDEEGPSGDEGSMNEGDGWTNDESGIDLLGVGDRCSGTGFLPPDTLDVFLLKRSGTTVATRMGTRTLPTIELTFTQRSRSAQRFMAIDPDGRNVP